jgi:hypothetical protein
MTTAATNSSKGQLSPCLGLLSKQGFGKLNVFTSIKLQAQVCI